MDTLGITEVARASGVSPDTLRHYERIGVLAPVERTRTGYRRYAPDAVRRVAIVRRALAVGFTLRELSEIFAIRKRGGAPCQKALRIMQTRLEEVETAIADLIAARNSMRTIIREWEERVEAAGSGRAGLLDSLIR